MRNGLTMDVYLSPNKPIPSAVPGWPAGTQATWPATTATLISGDRDAVLVDALMTSDESRRLAQWIEASGKNLTAVYVTHAHADHFFGLTSVLDAFPNATPVTLNEIVPLAQAETNEGHMDAWNSFFPGQITDHPTVPVALGSTEMGVEGHSLRMLDVGQSDTIDSSVVHIPDLDAVIAGDVAYNRTHMWLNGSDHTRRMEWIDALDTMEGLAPTTIITGHKDPAAPDDDAARILDESRQYIRDFDEAVAVSDSAGEIITIMSGRYPDLSNPYTLWVAAQDQTP